MAKKTTKKSVKSNLKKLKKLSVRQIICLTIFAILALGYLGGLMYENQIDDYFEFRQVETYSRGDTVEIGALSIHFIDVGQGDACLVELPDGKTVLIDAGDNKNSVKQALSTYIQKVNNNRETAFTYFDYVIMTHSDADHIGSMAYIVADYPAKTFFRPNEEMVRAISNDFEDPANYGVLERNRFWGEHGKRVETNNNKGTTYMNALRALYNCPDSEGIVTNPNSSDPKQNQIAPEIDSNSELYYEINFYGHKSSSYTDTNDYSPIIIIEYKGRSIALSGDCEKKGEEEFVELANGGQGRYVVFNDFTVDIVKLGHHGSRTSSSDAYLNKIIKSDYFSNVYVVISVGEGNSYKHPHDDLMQRINAKFDQEKIKRTDLDGDIVFDLVLLEGESEAKVFLGDVAEKDFYPISIFGIKVRYKNIGIAVLVFFGAILFLIAVTGAKKSKNKTSKGKK